MTTVRAPTSTRGVRDRAARSRTLRIAAMIARDQSRRVSLRFGRQTPNGARHIGLDVGHSVRYIEDVYRDYLRYGGLTAADLEGARVLEVGPGDNLGVGLRFLADGAAEFVGVDRFRAHRYDDQQQAIYEAVREALDPAARERASVERLERVEGVPAERAAEALRGRQFDLIISRAVLEHVYDTDATFDAMDALLAPGGRMLHKVDLRDHGMFTGGGLHPLEFLTVGPATYRRMTFYSGKPNRRLASWYRQKLAALGYDARFLVTHLVGASGDVDPHVESPADAPGIDEARRLAEEIRPRLLPGYSGLHADDLAVSGIFVIARKPA